MNRGQTLEKLTAIGCGGQTKIRKRQTITEVLRTYS